MNTTMNCPKCGGTTKTILTKHLGDRYGNLINKYEVARRKRCTQCDYRFYVRGLKNTNRHNRNPEKLLEANQVTYVGTMPYKNQKIRIIEKDSKLKRN